MDTQQPTDNITRPYLKVMTDAALRQCLVNATNTEQYELCAAIRDELKTRKHGILINTPTSTSSTSLPIQRKKEIMRILSMLLFSMNPAVSFTVWFAICVFKYWYLIPIPFLFLALTLWMVRKYDPELVERFKNNQ